MALSRCSKTKEVKDPKLVFGFPEDTQILYLATSSETLTVCIPRMFFKSNSRHRSVKYKGLHFEVVTTDQNDESVSAVCTGLVSYRAPKTLIQLNHLYAMLQYFAKNNGVIVKKIDEVYSKHLRNIRAIDNLQIVDLTIKTPPHHNNAMFGRKQRECNPYLRTSIDESKNNQISVTGRSYQKELTFQDSNFLGGCSTYNKKSSSNKPQQSNSEQILHLYKERDSNILPHTSMIPHYFYNGGRTIQPNSFKTPNQPLSQVHKKIPTRMYPYQGHQQPSTSYSDEYSCVNHTMPNLQTNAAVTLHKNLPIQSNLTNDIPMQYRNSLYKQNSYSQNRTADYPSSSQTIQYKYPQSNMVDLSMNSQSQQYNYSQENIVDSSGIVQSQQYNYSQNNVFDPSQNSQCEQYNYSQENMIDLSRIAQSRQYNYSQNYVFDPSQISQSQQYNYSQNYVFDPSQISQSQQYNYSQNYVFDPSLNSQSKEYNCSQNNEVYWQNNSQSRQYNNSQNNVTELSRIAQSQQYNYSQNNVVGLSNNTQAKLDHSSQSNMILWHLYSKSTNNTTQILQSKTNHTDANSTEIQFVPNLAQNTLKGCPILQTANTSGNAQNNPYDFEFIKIEPPDYEEESTINGESPQGYSEGPKKDMPQEKFMDDNDEEPKEKAKDDDDEEMKMVYEIIQKDLDEIPLETLSISSSDSLHKLVIAEDASIQ